MGVDEYVLPLVGQVSEHLAIQTVGSMFRIPANHCGNGGQQVVEFYKGYGFRITHYQDGPFGGEVYLNCAARMTQPEHA